MCLGAEYVMDGQHGAGQAGSGGGRVPGLGELRVTADTGGPVWPGLWWPAAPLGLCRKHFPAKAEQGDRDEGHSAVHLFHMPCFCFIPPFPPRASPSQSHTPNPLPCEDTRDAGKHDQTPQDSINPQSVVCPPHQPPRTLLVAGEVCPPLLKDRTHTLGARRHTPAAETIKSIKWPLC